MSAYKEVCEIISSRFDPGGEHSSSGLIGQTASAAIAALAQTADHKQMLRDAKNLSRIASATIGPATQPEGRCAEHIVALLADVAHLQAAPAPSSLAGGEVDAAVEHLTKRLNKPGAFHLGDEPHLRTILAALSPEARAREMYDLLPDEIDLFRIMRAAGRSNMDKAKAVAAHLQTLTPRHEAPAEGAGSFAGSLAVALEDLSNAAEVVRRMLHNSKDHQNRAFNEAGIPFVTAINRAKLVLKDYDRTRSSAPEAREGEGA